MLQLKIVRFRAADREELISQIRTRGGPGSVYVDLVAKLMDRYGWVQDKVIQLSPDVYVVTKFGIIRSREEFLDALKRRAT